MLTSRVIGKYALINLAELVAFVCALMVLQSLLAFPGWLFATMVALWILKDIVLFPKVWKAYSSQDTDPMGDLIGSRAIVVYGLDPAGYVRVRGELWNAHLVDGRSRAMRGDRARVVGSKGLTLIVEPIPSG